MIKFFKNIKSHVNNNKGEIHEKMILIVIAFVVGGILLGILSAPFTNSNTIQNWLKNTMTAIFTGQPIINHSGIPNADDLQNMYSFSYYSTLNSAIDDVNVGDIGANADATKENAVAGVYVKDEIPHVVLLQDVVLDTRIAPSADMTLNLGGNTLSSTNDVLMDIISGTIIIDGKLSGSTMQRNASSTSTTSMIQLRSGKLTVDGGSYISTNTNAASIAIKGGIGTNLTLNDCYVMGIHSGVQASGSLVVNGGIYEGYAHGGLYLCNSNEVSYITNATIRECSMPSGIDNGVVSNGAGMYIGGTNKCNITVYMDNCNIYGSLQPFVLRGIDGETNNRLFISNSTINKDCTYGIRVDNTTHKLYIGAGNNFSVEDMYWLHSTEEDIPEIIVMTDDVYCQ